PTPTNWPGPQAPSPLWGEASSSSIAGQGGRSHGWDRRLPDPEWSAPGQFPAATGRGPGLLLPDGNGLVPWLLARAAWLAGAGVSALVLDPPGGQDTGTAQPDHCNQPAVPLIRCRSGHSVPAWGGIGQRRATC